RLMDSMPPRPRQSTPLHINRTKIFDEAPTNDCFPPGKPHQGKNEYRLGSATSVKQLSPHRTLPATPHLFGHADHHINPQCFQSGRPDRPLMGTSSPKAQ